MVTRQSKTQGGKASQNKTVATKKPSTPAVEHPRKSPAPQHAAEAQHEPHAAGFPVVGVGASAGGLEAFEQLFRNVPPDSGMAFVLVSHLDPDHTSMLTDILQRSTSMPVIEAQDQMKVAPDCVYAIPPNRDMVIFNGALQLSAPDMPRGQRMVIDAFMRSLAEDQGERAVGIILSGTGTDGTLGLRAILGAGGISLVQEPASAKYDGMPVSAIGAGYATHILAPEKMPAALLTATRHLPPRTQPEPALAPPVQASGLNRVLLLLRSATGHDFSLYKKSTIGRRIERRMSQHDIGDMEVYARYLKEHPAEIQVLFKELLINVTSFFRDPEAFNTLRNDILPPLLADKPEGYVFRVWVAGCASGEEAYSIAILLRELMDETSPQINVQIYATDLDDDAIAKARAGSYPPNIAQDVAPERLRRHFNKDETGYRVKKEIREMVVFAIQNAIKDPPFTKLDLLSCRNMMIYLEAELQNRLIATFHYALKPGGVLFLSPSESIGNHTELFTPLNRKWKLYRATHSVASARTTQAWTTEKGSKVPEALTGKTRETNFAELARQLLLRSYAPASVVTDLNGNILYVHGETGKYLRPAPGQATLNVVDMAREGLQMELRAAVHHAASQGAPTLSRELSIKGNGAPQNMSFSVRPLPETGTGESLLLVSFHDLPGAAPDQAAPTKPARGKRLSGSLAEQRIAELERELSYTRENLQATIEEQQASNEELKSSNEEMQSTNEELITVNTELQAKIEQLARMQNDMKNLLDNINVGTIFLDDNLNIKRYTREAAQVYRLVASDVGRPLNDIKSNIDDADLLADAQSVLDTVREPLVVLDGALRVVSASRSFYRDFRVAQKDTVGRPIYELGNRQWDIPALRELLENILPQGRNFDDFAVEHDFPAIGQRKMLLNARRIVGDDDAAQMILLAMEMVV